MPKRSVETSAGPFNIVQQATGQAAPEPQPEKNPAAVALGRLGGLKGGNAALNHFRQKAESHRGKSG